jgi:vitamin B12/bleomycin/antimicrobial peptide transport system ATP-binding/permease protein
MAESSSRSGPGATAALRPFGHLWLALRRVLTSEIGGKARLLFGGIVVGLLGINGLNVVNSYVGRNLMTAIEERKTATFFEMMLLWAGVFTCLTLVAVIVRFFEERLALLWRDWLTRTFVARYLEDATYLRLKEVGELDNPDQRITEDVRAFTATTLSFILMGLNALLGIVAFSGVLWSISPLLFAAAAAYAALGSVLTVLVGRPLVRLNYDQFDREASFRAELVHAGENAESVALLQLESSLRVRMSRRIDALVANMKRIIAVHRRVGVFTTGYNYGIQLLPPLIVGPLFIRGAVDFGVVTQSAMAFSQLLGAFSLIVTQFASISSYAATLVRLGSFSTALDQPMSAARAAPPEDPRRVRFAYDDLTLYSRSSHDCLVAHLSVSVEPGTRLLITATDEARRALFRATALGRDASGSRVVYPAARVLFLPERPYVPPATLRQLIVQGEREHEFDDETLEAVLRDLDLEPALARVGGLDIEGDFSHALSLGEQQLLAVARVVLATPAFVVLHNPGSTLAPEQLDLALARLNEAQITYLTLGGDDSPVGAYDSVLEIHAGGTWGFRRDSQLPSRPNSQPSPHDTRG